MKFTVNEILVSYIKNLRKENELSVTAFANAIHKSKSYVTKFDNCEFKSVTYEDFATMFMAISPDNFGTLMDKYFLSLIENGYAKKNVDLEIDFFNYSNVIRIQQIPVPFIRKFNDMLNSKGLTVHDIVETANENKPVNHYSNFNIIPENEYSPTPVSDIDNDQKSACYIKVKLDEEIVQKILDSEITESHYYILLAMANAYYLLDLDKSEAEEIKNNKNTISLISAHNLLFNFHVESLEDHYKIKYIDAQMENLNHNLQNVSHSIQATLGSYVNLISKIYTQNYAYAERKVLGLRKNLEADAAFTIATTDLPFYKVKNLNNDNKKKLLRDIAALIDNYAKDEDYKEQIDLI